jgi:DNA repair exonuclease SbcCD ATPase subunit
MIIFKKLRWKNLLSTGNVFTEIELNKNNTTLIIGENGAGKSTILDALSFVLFGKPFRKVNKPQLLNTITQKNLVVEVEFSIGSNHYKIVRGIKPVIFEVYINDKLANQSAEMKDYQEFLERHILKVNHKSFCQVVVLGSATYQPFMQLTPAQRREIIEDLLDLQIFTTMNSLLKDKVLINTDKVNSTVNEKKIVESKISMAREHLLEMQSNNDQLVKDKQDRIEETNNQINDLNNEFWVYENKRKELAESIEDEGSISKKLEQLSKLKHQIEAKKAIIEKDINFFAHHENCPTCTQAISKEFRQITVESKTHEIETIEDGLSQLIEQYEQTDKRLNEIMDIHTEINNQRMEIHRLKTKITSLIEYRDSLDNEINSIKKNIKTEDDSKISEYEKELKDLEQKYNEYIEERSVLSAAGVLLKDGGIKSKIIKQYIPVINKLINKYLSAMEFMCQFELDEEFNETIKSRFRDIFSYASFSEGEKMRINLAILFTWRAVAKLRNSINTNLLIMDEVFDSSLDSNGTEEFLKIIKSLTSDTNTFIISHKGDQLFDKFEKVLKFEKHKNFSRIA